MTDLVRRRAVTVLLRWSAIDLAKRLSACLNTPA